MSKLSRKTYRELTDTQRRASKAGTASALKRKGKVDKELKRKRGKNEAG